MILDCVFISSYRAYAKKNDSPRISAAIFVVLWILGWFCFFLEAVCFYWRLNVTIATSYLLTHLYYLFPALIGLMVFSYFYFSDKRIEKILKDFENRSSNFRNRWGWITVITLILPNISTAILINNSAGRF